MATTWRTPLRRLSQLSSALPPSHYPLSNPTLLSSPLSTRPCFPPSSPPPSFTQTSLHYYQMLGDGGVGWIDARVAEVLIVKLQHPEKLPVASSSHIHKDRRSYVQSSCSAFHCGNAVLKYLYLKTPTWTICSCKHLRQESSAWRGTKFLSG